MSNMRASMVLALAFALILAGFVLVIAGSGFSGFSGGCFFWPFPIIIACGAGSGGTPYFLIIVGLIAVAIISFLSFFWMRKTISDFDKPVS